MQCLIFGLIVSLLCTSSIVQAGPQTNGYGKNITGRYIAGTPFARWKRDGEYKTNASQANFRNVTGGEIGKNVLFRSRCPDGNGKANRLADLFAEDFEVKYVINLYESDQELHSKYLGSEATASYYAKLVKDNRVTAIPMEMKFETKDQINRHRNSVIEGFKVIAAHSGPYLVHCSAGKDRTGFFCLTAGALMGMNYDQLLSDYMQSFLNFGYNSSRNGAIALCRNNLNLMLQLLTYAPSGSDWRKMNLKAKAERYLKDGGLNPGQIRSIKRHLKKSCPGGTRTEGGNYMLTVKVRDELTGKLISRRKVAYGGNAKLPPPRVHEGYEFIGWSDKGENITKDSEIVVRYKAITN